MDFYNIFDQDIYLVETKGANEPILEQKKTVKPAKAAYKISFLSKNQFTSDLSELLGKIVAATKIDKKIILVKDNVSEINQKYSAEFNILLGDIDSELPLNSPTQKGDFTYFQTHSLEEIQSDNAKKGVLWNSLKEMLKI